MPKERIFLSAVSRQFKTCRDALRSDLAAVGAEVVVQEDSTQRGGTLLQKLEDYIDACDRVIALVGDAHGRSPPTEAIPERAPARSYTQWEYHFALGERLDGTRAAAKPVYVYFAAPAYLEQHPVEQSDGETRSQRQFVEAIRASGKDRSAFDSIDQLARLVLRDGFNLSSRDKWLPQNLPYDSLGTLFKGRAGMLDAIRAKLCADSEQATAIVGKQAIHGLGGVGKTRLAVEYAWRHRADYRACLFVTADSRENLARHLAELCGARLLDLPEQNAQEQELQQAAVLHWLERHPGWLLILDNVDTPGAAAAVDELLPRLQSGHVLITSRRTDFGNSIHTLPLDTLDEDDAVAFLLEKTAARRTVTDDDDAAARTLVQALGGLALALEQAGAFINKKRISLQEYQQRWEQQEQKLRGWFDSRVMHYPMSLAVTWEASFELLSPHAQALLNLLSWFDPEPIPRAPIAAAFGPELLAPLIADVGSETGAETQAPDLEDLLDELETLSLLKWEAGNRGFSVHRLVQEITRTRLDDVTRSNSLQAAVQLLDAALPSDLSPCDVRAWPVLDSLRSHLERLVASADRAGIANPTSRLMNELGVYLQAKGLYREAEPPMRRTLAIAEVRLGTQHPEVATRLNNLSQLLQYTNRIDEAEPLIRRALAISEASFGPEHPNVARDLSNLALLLKDTNRLDEAELLMHRALEIDEASFGHEHPNVAIRLNNIAGLLLDTNRLDEAESLMRRALAIDEATFGPAHPRVAVQLNNFAQLLKATNRQIEAEPLMLRALAIDEASFGPEHPNVAIRLNNLGRLLHVTGRLDEAEPLMRRALEIDEVSFGLEHPDVAIDLNNLALLLQNTNRLDEAETLSRRVVEIFLLSTMRIGHKHPHLNMAIDNYMSILAALGHGDAETEAAIEALIESVRARA